MFLREWFMRSHYFKPPSFFTPRWAIYHAHDLSGEDASDAAGAPPATWHEFETEDNAKHQFRRAELKYRFRYPVHQPAEQTHHQFETPTPEYKIKPVATEYLEHMKKLPCNPTFYGTDQAIVMQHSLSLDTKTNNPSSRPRLRPSAADIWHF
jgi:hypothetical protein